MANAHVVDPFDGTGALSGNWTVDAGAAARSSGVLVASAAPFLTRYTGASFANDQYATIVVQTYATDDAAITRFNAAFSGYLIQVVPGGNLAISRIDGGALGANLEILSGLTQNVGDAWSLRSVGTAHRAYRNGVALGSGGTDATYASGSPGVSLTGTGDTVTLFEAGDTAISVAVAVTYEARQGVSASRASSHESRQPVSAARTSSHEARQPVTTTSAAAFEATQRAAASCAPVFESTGRVASAPAPAMESKQPVAAAVAVSHESKQPIAAALSEAYEARQLVSITTGSSHESKQPVSATRSASYEFTQPVSATRAASHESRQPVSATLAASHEAHQRVTAARAPTIESLQRVASTPAPSYEASGVTASPVSSTLTPAYESLRPVSATRSSSHESRQPVSTTHAPAHEARGRVAASLAASQESLQPVSRAMSTSYEAAGGIRRVLSSTLAWLGRVAATLLQPFESLSTRPDFETYPIEAQLLFDVDTFAISLDLDPFEIELELEPFEITFTPDPVPGMKSPRTLECSRGDTGFRIAGTFGALYAAGSDNPLPNLDGCTIQILIGEPGAYVAQGEMDVDGPLHASYELNAVDFGGGGWPNVPSGGGTYPIRTIVTRGDGAQLSGPSVRKKWPSLTVNEI